jgi:hypothetical protein
MLQKDAGKLFVLKMLNHELKVLELYVKLSFKSSEYSSCVPTNEHPSLEI